jgi:Tfp pilus assembly protein PilX
MKNINKNRKRGSVLLVSIFVSALFGAMVVGMMQLNTEEAMLVNNRIELTKAIAIAEAGLNDAYFNIRQDRNWTTGFTNKPLGSGIYSVTIAGTLPNRSLVSTGVTGAGYKARVSANIITGNSAPYSVRIVQIRINN